MISSTANAHRCDLDTAVLACLEGRGLGGGRLDELDVILGEGSFLDPVRHVGVLRGAWGRRQLQLLLMRVC